MHRRNSVPLTDILMRFLRDEGLETPLNQYRLVQAWSGVAGENVNAHTLELYIRNQTLYVRLDSPALRNNLMYARRQMVAGLNDAVGAQVIADIHYL